MEDDGLDYVVSTRMHNHRHIELLVVESGAMSVTLLTGERLTLNVGDILFLNSMTSHETEVLADHTRIAVLQFCLSDFLASSIYGSYKHSETMFLGNNKSHAVIKREENSSIYSYIRDILRENSEKKNGYDMFAVGALYFVVGELIRLGAIELAALNASRQYADYVGRALDFIEDNYSTDIKLSDVADAVSISVTHFCRIFKELTGKTFIEYLNLVRVSEAEKQIVRTGRGITEIASSVGFTSCEYFNRIFKRQYGIAPVKYRKIMRSE